MYIRFLFIPLMGMLLGACTDSRQQWVDEAPLISVQVTDALDRELSLPQSPRKVVSLVPNITELIYAMGAEDKLVARSEFCDFPEAVFEVEEVPLQKSFDLSYLRDLGAEVVLLSDDAYPPESYAEMWDSIPVFMQQFHSLDDVFESIAQLGELLAVEKKAQALTDSLRKSFLRIDAATQPEAKFRTLMLVDIEPLTVVGGKGYLHDLIKRSGGMNVFEAVDSAYVHPSVEEVLRSEPEFLIIPHKSDQAYNLLLEAYPRLYNTPADVYKQVFIVEPDLFFRPGPRLLDANLELTQILHSQLTEQEIFPERVKDIE